MTPQQLRLIYPLTRQPPASALTLIFMAYALAPVFVLCAAIDAAHRTFEVRYPLVRHLVRQRAHCPACGDSDSESRHLNPAWCGVFLLG